MMFRNRDLFALFAAVLLTRLAWKESLNVTASMHLLFYYPTHIYVSTTEQQQQKEKQAQQRGLVGDGGIGIHGLESSEDHDDVRLVGPVMLDIDGDGTAEAWVVLTRGWKIRLLDLKRSSAASAGGGSAAFAGPILPPTILESPPITNLSVPIALTTGHLPVTAEDDLYPTNIAVAASDGAGGSDAEEMTKVEVDERTKKYFCGKDWHDASEKCAQPCPRGDSDKCPGEERCFADTPCEYHVWLQQQRKQEAKRGLFGSSDGAQVTTPAGSVPVIVTLWDTGIIRCDGLVVSNSSTNDSTSSSSKSPLSLQIEPLWTVKHINLTSFEHQDLYASKIDFVDSITSSTKHGMILVTANTYVNDDYDEAIRFVMALNAKTGELLWETFTEEMDAHGMGAAEAAAAEAGELLLPLRTGLSSLARRRALPPPRSTTKAALTSSLSSSSSSRTRLAQNLNVPNCLHSFRRSLLTSGALPHVHWTDSNDVHSVVLHFDPQLKLQEQQQQQRKTRQQQKMHHRHSRHQHQQQQPKFGRPNVVVTYTDRGLSVRSLKNGHPLCRVDLWDRTLYGDVNHDGLLDSVHVLLSHYVAMDDDVENAKDPKRRWILQLAERVSGSAGQQKEEEQGGESRFSAPTEASLCHLQVLSGLPSKEELFSVNICRPQGRGGGGRRQKQPDRGNEEFLEAAPPLLVEPRSERRKGSDVVTAVSGVLTRVDGETGKIQWQLYDDLPVWDDDEVVLLTRIESPYLAPRARPILLAGEESMAIFSPHGVKLASTKFPQPSIMQPLLMDVNGDGVIDVVIVTTDAIWAYPVHLRATTTSLFRMTVGFVLLGILLALLRNQFQQHPGKRSTDS